MSSHQTMCCIYRQDLKSLREGEIQKICSSSSQLLRYAYNGRLSTCQEEGDYMRQEVLTFMSFFLSWSYFLLMYASILTGLSTDGEKENRNHKRAELSTKLGIDLWEYRRWRTRPTVDSTEKKEKSPPLSLLSLWGDNLLNTNRY